MADSALNGSCKFLMTSNIRQIEKEIQVNYRLDDNDHTSVSITPPLMTNWTGGGTRLSTGSCHCSLRRLQIGQKIANNC